MVYDELSIRRRRGFSVVELLCATAIVAILAAGVAPGLRAVDELMFDYTVRRLVNDLRYLQQLSMNSVRGANKFPKVPSQSVPMMYFQAGGNGSYRIVSDLQTLRKLQFSNNIRLSGNVAAVTFNNDGYINQPRTITLRQGNKIKKVIIDRVGRIRVE